MAVVDFDLNVEKMAFYSLYDFSRFESNSQFKERLTH